MIPIYKILIKYTMEDEKTQQIVTIPIYITVICLMDKHTLITVMGGMG